MEVHGVTFRMRIDGLKESRNGYNDPKVSVSVTKLCFVSMLLRSHGLCTFSFPDSHSSPFSLWYFSLSTFDPFPDFSCFSISSFLLFTIRFSVSLFRFLWKRRSRNAFFCSETLIFWSVWLSRKFLPLMEKVLFVCFNLRLERSARWSSFWGLLLLAGKKKCNSDYQFGFPFSFYGFKP